MKKEHFEAIGGFDEQLVTCEDCDLGYRLSERGDLLYVPAATHIHFGESKSLNEVLWREAWRSQGNLRLAFSRPADWKNWLSLLLPVVFTSCIMLGTVGSALALMGVGRLLPFVGLVVIGGSVPIVFVLRKQKKLIGLRELVSQWTVIATFLAGRALGLVWRFPRVERC